MRRSRFLSLAWAMTATFPLLAASSLTILKASCVLKAAGWLAGNACFDMKPSL
jgi:hypothetical protein